ncbi:MAG TPA: hypothetical protein PLD51_01950 [Pontiellaceae bacterium]|nr:hypothetical protein [Pontiellaceae bacterium]
MHSLPKDHPLVGTWITSDEDSDVAVTIEVQSGKFKVSSFTRSDGEFHKVENVKWAGNALSFDSTVPSNGWQTKHVFRIKPDGSAEVELTWSDVWKKKDVKPGEPPESWQANS